MSKIKWKDLPPEFTYEISGMQLNITLETGESVCLSKAYIESLI